jgi:IS5 family transposase
MQTTFTDIEYSNRKKKTRKEKFFEQMEKIMSWTEIYGIIAPFYEVNRKQVGRKKTPLSIMTRMYLVSNWFTLSDPATEEEAYDSYAMRTFIGVNFNDPTKQVPDETCLCKFRHLLEEHNLCKKIEDLIVKKLDECGLIMHGGTIVDASIFAAPKSRKNEKKERDPEMKSTKKGANYYFGSKMHIGVCAGSGYIHSHTTTAANVHDVTEAHNLIREDDNFVSGDSGYLGLENRDEIRENEQLAGKRYEMVKRPSRMRKFCGILGEVITKPWEKKIEHPFISRRQKVEYPFHIIKNIFGYRKNRYKGIAKNENKNCIMCALTNIYMVAKAGKNFALLPSMG